MYTYKFCVTVRKKNSVTEKLRVIDLSNLQICIHIYIYISIYIYLCVCLCIIRISAVDVLLIDTKPRFVAFDLFVFAIL